MTGSASMSMSSRQQPSAQQQLELLNPSTSSRSSRSPRTDGRQSQVAQPTQSNSSRQQSPRQDSSRQPDPRPSSPDFYSPRGEFQSALSRGLESASPRLEQGDTDGNGGQQGQQQQPQQSQNLFQEMEAKQRLLEQQQQRENEESILKFEILMSEINAITYAYES
jgi:hypothetical protein